jgi:large subunit ribosomal protein L31
MKSTLHPVYHDAIEVSCSCGHTFTTGSTVEKITVEVCSNCHPFYTGKQKLVDAAGRVDKFKRRLSNTSPLRSRKRR